MSKTKKEVFISYRKSDGTELANALNDALERSAYKPYLDADDPSRGRWDDGLKTAIHNSKVFLPVVTEGYIERLKSEEDNVVKMEFACALSCLGESGIVPYFASETEVQNGNNVIVQEEPTKILLGALKAAIADKKELMRLVSGICPTAYLEKAEAYSAQEIDKWRAAQENLLYDPQNPIQRRLSVDNAEIPCTPDELLELLDTHKNICISGDGGCGKTFLLQQIFDMLRENHHYIAIYVKLFEAENSFDAKKANPILNYVQEKIEDRENDLIREMHEEDRAPKVVFLLDGLNEVAKHQLQAISAINRLTELSGVSNVILTTRYLPSDLANKFTSVRICDLEEEEIRRYLGVEECKIDPGSVLKLPLYLRLYKLSTIKKQGDMQGQAPNLHTKYALLKEVFVDHPVDKFGNALTEELRAAYAYLLPFLCFRMTNDGTKNILEKDFIDSMEACKESIPQKASRRSMLEACFCFGRGISFDVLEKAKEGQLRQRIKDQLFPQVGDGESGPMAQFEICHQDIRDFFAAHYVKSSLDYLSCMGVAGAENVWKDTLEEFKNETFDTDTAPLLLETLKNQLVLPIEESFPAHKLCVSLLHFLYYLSNNSIDRSHNGSREKRDVCELFKASLDSARCFILENKEALCLDPSDLVFTRIIVQDAEIHRRLGKYDKSSSILEQLKQLTDLTKDDELHGMVMNNIAKCTLYRAFDLAESAEGAYEDVAAMLYAEAIRQLRENADCYLSANLLAMLQVNPDPVSRKYLEAQFGGDMAARRYQAYTIESRAYALSKSRYALQTLLSYLLHGYIKVIGIQPDGEPRVEKNPDDQLWDIRENKSEILRIADRYLEELSKAGSSIIPCFQGLRLLQDEGTFASAMEKLKSSYRINYTDNVINGSCLGCFVYTLVNDRLPTGTQAALLDAIWRTADKKLTEHSADNFDFAYVLADLQCAWQGIKHRFPDKLSEELLSRVDMEFEALSEKCQREDKKWNP